jgi:hypothetical protein
LLRSNDVQLKKKIIFYSGLLPESDECDYDYPTPFRVKESLALLRTIFPNYPDLKDMKPIPDLEHFLEAHRSDSSEAA